MSLKELVQSLLEEKPPFRERINKDKGIASLLIRKHGLEPFITRGEMTRDRLASILQDYGSMDRAWRQILEKNTKLRGTDYDEKDELEAKKMAELGYNVPRNIGEAIIMKSQETPKLL